MGIAVLSEERRPLADLLGDFPELAERATGQEIEQVRGAGPLRQRTRRRVAGRVLLVGDASGYVDALTGEGIALGLAQARAAVDAVRAGRPQDYEPAWRRLGWRHDLLTRGLLAATRHPALRSRVVPAAARLPWVFGLAVDQLARPA
jgi:flavin-dependent dehydrogenase